MAEAARQDSFFPPLFQLAYALGCDVNIDLFIRENWRIVPDPDDTEFVREPELQIRGLLQNGYLQGDCDDSATLAASMCLAIQCPSVLIAIRLPHAAEFSHVFCRTANVDIDPIVPVEQLPIPSANIEETMTVFI